MGQGVEALGLSAEEALAQLGNEAVDVYLNNVAYWRGVPCGCGGAGAGDADGLVCRLAEARQVEDGRQQRAREGKSRPEDFQSPMVP